MNRSAHRRGERENAREKERGGEREEVRETVTATEGAEGEPGETKGGRHGERQ